MVSRYNIYHHLALAFNMLCFPMEQQIQHTSGWRECLRFCLYLIRKLKKKSRQCQNWLLYFVLICRSRQWCSPHSAPLGWKQNCNELAMCMCQDWTCVSDSAKLPLQAINTNENVYQVTLCIHSMSWVKYMFCCFEESWSLLWYFHSTWQWMMSSCFTGG